MIQYFPWNDHKLNFHIINHWHFSLLKNCKHGPFIDFQKGFSSDLKLAPLTYQFMGSTCGKSRAIIFAENVRAFLKVWHFRRCFAAFGKKKPLPYTRKNASAPSCLQGKLRDRRLFCTPNRMHPNHPLKSRSLLFSLVKTLFLVDGNKMQIRNDINEYGSLLATLNQYLRYSIVEWKDVDQ